MELNLFSFVFFMFFCKLKTNNFYAFLFTLQPILVCLAQLLRLWIIYVTANCTKMRSVTQLSAVFCKL